VANTSGLHVGNSTVNTHLIVPTSAQYSATNYFLHANGSWIQVSAGSSATQVYQAYTATASQTTFAVSGGYTVGMVDVFYNGDKLARSEFTATDGSNVVLGVGAISGAIVEVVGWIAAGLFQPTAGGSNTQVQFNDSTALGGSAGFTFDKATNNAVLANTLNVAIISQGNSTANLYTNSILITIANSTGTANLNPATLTIGTSVVNSTAFAEGANVIITTSTFFMGNSTVNSVCNSTAEVVQNSTVQSIYGIGGINAGANVYLNTTTFFMGNSTVNAVCNSTADVLQNSTVQTILGIAGINAGANVFLNTTTFFMGNSTVNLVCNSTAEVVQNSTVQSIYGIAGVNAGANVYLNTTNLFIGNTTANATANSILVQVINSTATANITPASFATGSSLVNATVLFVGNSTVNATVNSISLYVTNSTVNTTLTIPTSAQWTATNFFLHANGTWVQVAAGGGNTGCLNNVQIYTTTGAVWTKPTGLAFVIVECVGGGGAGAGCGTAAANIVLGSGGGAGGYCRKKIAAASLGASENATVGTGGGAGATGAAGGAGGSSSFGTTTFCTASGGAGGVTGGAALVPQGGSGGLAASGDVNVQGGDGTLGVLLFGSVSGMVMRAGDGGSSYFGGGGEGNARGVTGGAQTPNPGKAFGSGGGGGTPIPGATVSGGVGGAGKQGIVIVWEYV